MNAVAPLEGIRLATVDGLKPYGRPENSSPAPRTGRTQLDAVPLATIQEGLSVGRTTARAAHRRARPHPGRLPPLIPPRYQNCGGRRPTQGAALRRVQTHRRPDAPTNAAPHPPALPRGFPRIRPPAAPGPAPTAARAPDAPAPALTPSARSRSAMCPPAPPAALTVLPLGLGHGQGVLVPYTLKLGPQRCRALHLGCPLPRGSGSCLVGREGAWRGGPRRAGRRPGARVQAVMPKWWSHHSPVLVTRVVVRRWIPRASASSEANSAHR